MIDRPIYYNNPLEIEFRGLNRDQVINGLVEQKDKRFGLFVVIQAAAFIAISCVAFALVAYFSQSAFKAVVLSTAGFIIGGGSAYLFYNHFFAVTKVISDLRVKYKGEGEIALSDLAKILAVSTVETRGKLLKQMSFEQAVIAKEFISPEKFKMWVKGSDWSAVFNFNEEKISDFRPVIEKNQWVLRAIEPNLSEKQYFNLARRNLMAQPSEVFGIINFIEKTKEEMCEGEDKKVEFPIPELVKKLMAGEYVEMNKENILAIIDTAEWLNSGELFRFLDEHVHTHIDQYNQNDLVELVQICPNLILVRSYLARQILSRNISLENWRELWMLASKVAKSELREKFSDFILDNNISDIEIVKDVLTFQNYKNWLLRYVAYHQALEIFKKELESPTKYFEVYYNFIKANWFINWEEILKITKDNILYLMKIPDLKKEVETYVAANWKILLLEKDVSFEILLNHFPKLEKQILEFLKDNHSELIDKKIITKKAWKDYKFIYFT